MIKRYCKSCKKETWFEEYTDSKGFERVFFGIFTLGAAELMRQTWIECCECETTILT